MRSEDAEVFESTDVILGLFENTNAGNEGATTTEQLASTGGVSQATTTGEIEPQATPADSLESRSEFVDQLPVIGSGAPLAFVGRAWQRVESEENASLMTEQPESDLRDDGDEIVLELEDDEEFMKFTIPGESDPEQPDANVSVDDGGSAAVKISAEKNDEELTTVDSHILYFPESGSDKVKSEQFEEFASEVGMTLQAIRDQLQNMTERQYLQERETHELHKSIAELSGDSSVSGRKQNKKSS